MQQAHRNASVDGQSDSPRRGAVRVFVRLTFDIKAHSAHEFFHRVFLIFGIFGKALHSLFPMHRIDESSSAKRSHLHALTEPDVHLSIHQALIVQPLSSTTRARTAQARILWCRRRLYFRRAQRTSASSMVRSVLTNADR